MKHYKQKMVYLLRRYNYICPIAFSNGHYAFPTELHHRVHNTKVNRMKYPLFIDSIWNLVPVNHDWHMMWPSWGRLSYREAQRREDFLERHPKIAKKINFST